METEPEEVLRVLRELRDEHLIQIEDQDENAQQDDADVVRVLSEVINDLEMRHPVIDAGGGAELILFERLRQRDLWGADHDDRHLDAELAYAAATYTIPPEGRAYLTEPLAAPDHSFTPSGSAPLGWPFESEAWRPGDRVNELTKAGALIAAEIDRLLRQREAG